MVSSGGRDVTGGGSSGRVTPKSHRGPSRGRWDLGAGDAESVLAEARKALFVMAGFLAVIWVLQIANWADQYQLTLHYGIRPRDIGSLPDVISAPFLHFSWAHIEGNSGPLFIFGFLAAWLAEPANTVGAGASGLVFGYFGYIMVRGFFDRHVIDMVIGAIMALCFAYQFAVLLPHAGIGWQAHLGGLTGGVAAGWIFRERRPKAPAKPAPVTGVTGGVNFPGTQPGMNRKPS